MSSTKRIAKRLLAVILTVMVVMSMLTIGITSTASAATTKTVYLVPGDWDQAGAWYAAYTWGSAESWVKMTDSDGDGTYEADVPAANTMIIFTRNDPAKTALDWDSKWNQSGDETIPTDGKNLYTITNPWSESGTGTWSTYTAPDPVEPGDASAFYLMGTLTDWSTGKNMVYSTDTKVVTITLDLDAGEYKFKVKTGSSWYGYNELTLPETVEGATIGSADSDGNVVITVDGGTYTFNYTIASKSLDIAYKAPVVTSSTAPATSSTVPASSSDPDEDTTASVPASSTASTDEEETTVTTAPATSSTAPTTTAPTSNPIIEPALAWAEDDGLYAYAAAVVTGENAWQRWTSVDSTRYFYLPATVNGEVAVFNTYDDDVTVNGVTIAPGMAVAVPFEEGKSYTCSGATTQTVKFYVTDAEGSIFINSADGMTTKDDAGTKSTVDATYDLYGFIIGGSKNQEVGKAAGAVVSAKDGILDDTLVKKMKGRGNTTWTDESGKKPFNITYDENIQIDGMKGKKWSLLANAKDSSLLRNRLVYDMANEVDMTYACDSRFVDFFVNGRYKGSYQLTQKIEMGKNTVMPDLTEPEVEEVDGVAPPTADFDFILELDTAKNASSAGDMYFTTSRGQVMTFKTPDEPTSEQQAFMKAKYQAVEDALYGDDMATLEDLVDMDDFAKAYLVNEVSKNIDAGVTSCYFTYNSATGKFYTAPVWDYDNAVGNLPDNGDRTDMSGNVLDLDGPSGWYAKELKHFDLSLRSVFSQACYNTSETADGKTFADIVKSVWDAEFVGVIDVLEGTTDATNGRLNSVDGYMANLAKSGQWNFDFGYPMNYSWTADTSSLKMYDYNASTNTLSSTTKSYNENSLEGQADYAGDWLISRLNWMAAQYAGAGTGTDTPTGDTTLVYLAPGDWEQASAWYAVYSWKGGSEYWAKMTKAENGYYEATISADVEGLIFVRMDASKTDLSWDSKWNQSGDETLPTNGNRLYTITNPWSEDGTGTWSYIELPTEPTTTAPASSSTTPASSSTTPASSSTAPASSSTTPSSSVTDPTESSSVVVDTTKTTVYLDPKDWDTAGAWYAIYTWNGGDEVWYKMTDADDDGLYEATISTDIEGLIFVRMDASKTDLSWDSKWNQSSNETLPANGDRLYTITDAWNEENTGTWGKAPVVTDPTEPSSSTTPASSSTTPASSSTTPSSVTDPTESSSVVVDTTKTTVYLDPKDWDTAGAWYAIYTWNGGDEVWYKMTDADNDGLYEATISTDIEGLIFVRMDASKTDLSWDSKWNQSGNETLPANGDRLYTITDAWNEENTGTWGKAPVVTDPTEPSSSTTPASSSTVPASSSTAPASSSVPESSSTVVVAGDPKTAYLAIGDAWANGTKFAACYWVGTEKTWVEMTATADSKYYKTEIPENAKFFFAVMADGTTELTDENAVYTTADTEFPSDELLNCYVILRVTDEGGTYGMWSNYYEKVVYNVTWTESDAYTVNAPTTVEEGMPLTFTVDAADGYKVAAVIVDMQILTADSYGNYTIANVTKDINILVVAAEDVVVSDPVVLEFEVTFVDKDGNVLDTQTVEYGKSATAPTAPTVEGYTFKGWDTDFDYVTKDITVTAQYKKNVVPATTGTLKIEIAGGTGFTIAVNGGAARPQGSSYLNTKAPIGATVTLVANSTSGAQFMGWINPANGAVLTMSTTYTFTTTGNDSIKAVFVSAIDGVNRVTFYNDRAFGGTGQILDMQYYAAGDELVFPDAPSLPGYVFTGWSLTETEIQQQLTEGYDVNVYPTWELAKVYVAITVNNGTITGFGGQNDEGKYLAYNGTTVKANDAEAGFKFAYWVDANKKIVSYDAEYKFYPAVDTVLTAVYVADDATIEYKPIVGIAANPTASGEVIDYTLTWFIPESVGTTTGVGFIVVDKDNYNEDTFFANSTDSNVFTGTLGSKYNTAEGTFVASKSKSYYDNTYVACTWVQYTDADGNTVIVYSDPVEVTKLG